jgi:hypothetical protein
MDTVFGVMAWASSCGNFLVNANHSHLRMMFGGALACRLDWLERLVITALCPSMRPQI